MLGADPQKDQNEVVRLNGPRNRVPRNGSHRPSMSDSLARLRTSQLCDVSRDGRVPGALPMATAALDGLPPIAVGALECIETLRLGGDDVDAGAGPGSESVTVGDADLTTRITNETSLLELAHRD